MSTVVLIEWMFIYSFFIKSEIPKIQIFIDISILELGGTACLAVAGNQNCQWDRDEENVISSY